jgi:hypothetical protein
MAQLSPSPLAFLSHCQMHQKPGKASGLTATPPVDLLNTDFLLNNFVKFQEN